jgi:hypothetical protein
MDTEKLGRIEGIAYRITGGDRARLIGITELAGSACTSASMTPVAFPTARSCRTLANPMRGPHKRYKAPARPGSLTL